MRMVTSHDMCRLVVDPYNVWSAQRAAREGARAMASAVAKPAKQREVAQHVAMSGIIQLK